MQSIHICDMPYAPRYGAMPIKRLTLDRDHVYIEGQDGRLWRITLHLEHPLIEALPRTHLEPR